MLRIIVLLLIASNLYAKMPVTDAKVIQQLEDFTASLSPTAQQQSFEHDSAPVIEKKDRIIIFISASMSEQSILQWAKQADLLDAELVMRGFIDNDFKQTVLFAQRLFVKERVGGFNIDPFLFKKYAIEIVPTVVLDVAGTVDIVAGDMGLIEALKIISEQGENKQHARNILSKI